MVDLIFYFVYNFHYELFWDNFFKRVSMKQLKNYLSLSSQSDDAGVHAMM